MPLKAVCQAMMFCACDSNAVAVTSWSPECANTRCMWWRCAAMAPHRRTKRTCTSAVPTLLSLPSELLCQVALHLDLEERRVAHDHARCECWVVLTCAAH